MNITQHHIFMFIRKNLIHENIVTKEDEIIAKAISYFTGCIPFKPECFHNRFDNEDDMKHFIDNIYHITKTKSHRYLLDYPNTKDPAIVMYLKKNIDEVLILSTFAKLQYEDLDDINSIDEIVIEAIQRSSHDLAESDLDEIADYLNQMDDRSIDSFISNIKGIVHELKFAELENIDDDAISAMLFPDTNHKGADALLTNSITGDQFEVQLKATDSIHYVRDSIEQFPDVAIKVTEELAEKYDLESSGISNSEITAQVEETIDSLSNNDEKTIWSYVPVITLISIAIIIILLWKKYKNNQISKKEFYSKSIQISGLKISKVLLFSFLLTIPGINFATSVFLIARQVNAVAKIFN